jgi:hypothetical protein
MGGEETMDKKITKWMRIIEQAKKDILGTLNYNGLILDDLDELLADMEKEQKALEQAEHSKK